MLGPGPFCAPVNLFDLYSEIGLNCVGSLLLGLGFAMLVGLERCSVLG